MWRAIAASEKTLFRTLYFSFDPAILTNIDIVAVLDSGYDTSFG